MAFTPTSPKPKAEEKFLPQINLDVDQVPSKFLTYPKGSTIKYRPYSYGEVKRISQSKHSKKDEFNVILEGIECSFDKMDLTVSDLLYLGLLRKISTLGTTKVEAKYDCSGCKKVVGKVFQLTDLSLKDLEVPDLPVVVDLDCGEFEFTPLTVKDCFDLIDKDKVSDHISLLATMCRNKPFEKAYELFFNCSSPDGMILEEVDSLLRHEVAPIEAVCKCKAKTMIELDGGQALLLPFRKSKKSARSRIRFGNKGSDKPS